MKTGAALLVLALVVSGQTPPAQKPTGVISGRVVTTGSSAPIEGAVMKLTNLEHPPGLPDTFTQESDARGEFLFVDLPPGRYELTATRNRYLPSTYGQKRPGSGGPGVSIRLANGQHVDGVSVSMALPAVIAGMVTDARGEPAQFSVVRLLRYDWVAGQRTLREDGVDVADDRGSYRIPGLRPGEYLVVASARFTDRNSGDPPPPAQIFYPGTPLIQSAQSIVVEPGEERPGVDFQLRLVRLASVSGSVIPAPGQRFQGAHLIAVNRGVALAPVTGITQFSTYGVDGSGHFTLINLAPGHYQLTATASGDSTDSETEFWAMAEVDVDADDRTDIRLPLQRGSTMSGRIVPDPAKPAATTVGTVVLEALDPGRKPVICRLDADKQFAFEGIMPGRYVLRFTFLPPGIFIRSIRVGGRDVTDAGIEIGPSEAVRDVEVRMTDAGSTITGTLLDAAGQPTPDYLVLIFPVDEKYWLPGTPRIRTTRPGTDGQYAFRNLPPGAYRLAALLEAEPNEWSAPSFLKKVASASPNVVTIAEGETRTQSIQIR